MGAGRVHSFGSQTWNSMVSDMSDGSLQWSDEYNSSSNDYDLFVLNAAGTMIVTSSTNPQNGAEEPFEFVNGVQPGERIVVVKFGATAADRYLRLSFTGGPLQFGTEGQTIGHAGTPNCICVAASEAPAAFPNPFTTSSTTEISSSDGPHKMFYQPNGTPITPGNFLSSGGMTVQTPALTAADGGVTTLPPTSGLNPFYGTSAAAPHAAAIAALVKQRNPSLTNTQIRAALEASCLDIELPGFEVNSGNGILMADLALAAVSPVTEFCFGDGGNQMGCTDCPCGNNAPIGTMGGCLNSTAASARLVRSGSDSIVAADLRFDAENLLPGTMALLVTGPMLASNIPSAPCFGQNTGIQSPAFSGLRCVVGNILRHGGRVADSSGDIGATNPGWGSPDPFINFGAFIASTTQNFQVFYRDVPHGSCSLLLNTTQASQVTFTP